MTIAIIDMRLMVHFFFFIFLSIDIAKYFNRHSLSANKRAKYKIL